MSGQLDKLFGKLASKPQAANALFAISGPEIAWRGVPDHPGENPVFCIASCTKLYTAALIFQMVDAGKIVLDAKAERYLPDSLIARLHILKGTDYSSRITVRHLLSNSSGLPDYFEEAPKGDKSYMARIAQNEDIGWSDAEALERARRLEPHFAPGSAGKAHYSDTNFQLLGALLEEVSGQGFDKLVASRISVPIGQNDTFVYTPRSTNEYDRIVPILSGTKPLYLPKTFASLGAQGGVMSTLDDMLIFLKAFFAGQLFARHWIEDIQKNWNRVFFPFRYGTGIMLFSLHPVFTMFRRLPPLVGHSGSSGVLAYYCPERDIYITGSTNQIGTRGLPYQFALRALSVL